MAECIAAVRTRSGVLVVHGNGPQVGNLGLQQEAAAADVPAQPLHLLGAMTQGQLGSVLVREIDSRCGPGSAVALVTHVEVHESDPAFAAPTKFVGPFLDRGQAEELAGSHGWQVREDVGRGWRRVVPSPRPVAVLELAAIRDLLGAGHVVVAGGGGGVPVRRDPDGGWPGVEGVIDKDHAAVLLAAALGADALYLLTGVDAVRLDFGTPRERPVHQLTVAQAKAHLADDQFAAGSMRPKIEAALDFLAGGGERVVITSAERLGDVGEGREVGTTIRAGDGQPLRAGAPATTAGAQR
jgi:carbamate kinase